MNNMCPAPWISRMIHSNEEITPCCYTRTNNIDRLKEEFSNNKRPLQCSYCWYQEEHNLSSPRIDLIRFVGDTKINSVRLLTLNLGTYCNAECIMCNGHSSSKRNTWIKKHNKIEYIYNSAPTTNLQIDFSQYPELEMITLIGGEPMIHPDTKPLLKKIIEIGLAKNITISFNTNASIFDEEIVTLLKQFKSILVTLSIDGAGEYFEYQRRPLKWSIVKEIGTKWMQISESIVINYVVSAVSIWGFNEFVDWYEHLPTEILDKNPEVILVHVNDKQYLTLNVLTEQQKTDWISAAVDHKFKQPIIDILSTTRFNINLVTELFSKIELEDASSKVKFNDIFPKWNLNAKA